MRFLLLLLAVSAFAAPADYQSLQDQGWTRLKKGDKGGLDDVLQAHALKPRSAEANVSLGAALGTVGRYQQSLSYYRIALRFDAGDYHAYEGLGSSYAWLGRNREAAGAYEQAAKRAPPGERERLARLSESRALLAAGARPVLESRPPDGYSRSAELLITAAQERSASDSVEEPDLLAALLADGSSDAAAVLKRLAVGVPRLRAELELPAVRSRKAGVRAPFSPAVYGTLRRALVRANASPCSKASSALLLAAVIEDSDPATRAAFERQGVNRDSILAALGGVNRQAECGD
jgi:tetratricopeptide (TPR) repeat protein